MNCESLPRKTSLRVHLPSLYYIYVQIRHTSTDMSLLPFSLSVNNLYPQVLLLLPVVVMLGLGVSRKKQWGPESIPDLTGRVAIVTGGNTGLGYITVRELARKGAHV